MGSLPSAHACSCRRVAHASHASSYLGLLLLLHQGSLLGLPCLVLLPLGVVLLLLLLVLLWFVLLWVLLVVLLLRCTRIQHALGHSCARRLLLWRQLLRIVQLLLLGVQRRCCIRSHHGCRLLTLVLPVLPLQQLWVVLPLWLLAVLPLMLLEARKAARGRDSAPRGPSLHGSSLHGRCSLLRLHGSSLHGRPLLLLLLHIVLPLLLLLL